MVKYFLLFSIPIILASCDNKSKSGDEGRAPLVDSTDKYPLFPYPLYIAEQIAYVDSTPLGILKLVYENGKKIDSGYIDRNEFHQLAKEFSTPNLNDTMYRPHYTEKSFQDLTINSITFSITAKDAKSVVRQADILLNPDTKKIKNIIIKKHVSTTDSSETKNLLWVNNMNFQINSFVLRKDGSKTERTLKVIWDKPIDKY